MSCIYLSLSRFANYLQYNFQPREYNFQSGKYHFQPREYNFQSREYNINLAHIISNLANIISNLQKSCQTQAKQRQAKQKSERRFNLLWTWSCAPATVFEHWSCASDGGHSRGHMTTDCICYTVTRCEYGGEQESDYNGLFFDGGYVEPYFIDGGALQVLFKYR